MKKEFRQVIRKNKIFFLIKLLISIFLRGSVLIIPIFYSYAIEEITAGRLNKAYLLGIFLLIATIVYYLLEMVNDDAYEKLYYKLYLGFTKIALDFTEKNSVYSLSRIPLGEFHSMMTSDINVISDYYGNIPMAIARVIEFCFVFFYFFSVNLFIGFLFIIVSIFVFITLYFGNRKVNKINVQDKETHDQRLGVLQEYFLGMKEIKGFHLFQTMNQRIENSYQVYLNWHTKYGFWKVVVKYGTLGIIDVSKVLFLFYGFYLAFHGKMSLAVIILVYSYFDKLISNVTSLLDFNIKLQDSKVARKRLFKLKEFSHEAKLIAEEKSFQKGTIVFENVVYGNKEDPILNHFTAQFHNREITVITGVTGSGKTGIIDLLLKLNKQHEGTIFIDGLDINEYPENIYFSSIAAVRKDPSFFHMSIRDNLEIVQPDFEKIVEVCKEIGIHEEIMKLRNGYDTVITENASNITADMKYLLSLVRVILKEPKIILLDETLNAFPKEVDFKILDYFENHKRKYNVILISKEKHVMERADQVVLMEQGKVIASGKHEKLLKDKEYQDYFQGL